MDIKLDQRAIERAAQEATRAWASKVNPVMSRLTRECAGQPADTVKARLRQEWRAAAGKDLTDPELSEFAEAISTGRGLQFKAK